MVAMGHAKGLGARFGPLEFGGTYVPPSQHGHERTTAAG